MKQDFISYLNSDLYLNRLINNSKGVIDNKTAKEIAQYQIGLVSNASSPNFENMADNLGGYYNTNENYVNINKNYNLNCLFC